MSRESGELRPSPTLISNGSGPISWNAIGAKLRGLIRNQGEERLYSLTLGGGVNIGVTWTRAPVDRTIRTSAGRGRTQKRFSFPGVRSTSLPISRRRKEPNFSALAKYTESMATAISLLISPGRTDLRGARQGGDLPYRHGEYGVLSIVWILLGYFAFLDLGVSRVSANALARIGHSSRKQGSKVLIAAFCLCLCLGLISGFVLYFACSFLLEHVVAVPADLKAEIADSFPCVVSLLPLAIVGGRRNGGLENRRAFVIDSESAIRYSDTS
jgi:hypothetical protein